MSPTQEEIYPPFQEGKQYVPVFATCKVPEEYLRTLFQHATRESFDLMPIITPSELTRERLIQDLKEASDQCLIQHVYFPNASLEHLWDFFVALLRSPPDAAPGSSGFSNFTFALIDTECLARDPPAIKICTDAPDEEDDLEGLIPPEEGREGWEPKFPAPCLRTLIAPVELAVGIMRNLEMLVTTCTEFEREKEMHASVMPPPILQPTMRRCAEAKWMGLAARERERRKGGKD